MICANGDDEPDKPLMSPWSAAHSAGTAGPRGEDEKSRGCGKHL